MNTLYLKTKKKYWGQNVNSMLVIIEDIKFPFSRLWILYKFIFNFHLIEFDKFPFFITNVHLKYKLYMRTYF